jgi:hypothetical protein
MTAVATLAGAPCYEVEVDWNRINWKKVNRNVRRLQARIVKAIEEGLLHHHVLPRGVSSGSSRVH